MIKSTTSSHRRTLSHGAQPTKIQKNSRCSEYSQNTNYHNEKVILDKMEGKPPNIVYNFNYANVHKQVSIRDLKLSKNDSAFSDIDSISPKKPYKPPKTAKVPDLNKAKVEGGSDFHLRMKTLIYPAKETTAIDNCNSLKTYLNQKLMESSSIKLAMDNKMQSAKLTEEASKAVEEFGLRKIRRIVSSSVLRKYDLTKTVTEFKMDQILDRIQEAKKDDKKREQLIQEVRFGTWNTMIDNIASNVLQDVNHLSTNLTEEVVVAADKRTKKLKKLALLNSQTGNQTDRLGSANPSPVIKKKIGSVVTFSDFPTPSMRRLPVHNLASQNRFAGRFNGKKNLENAFDCSDSDEKSSNDSEDSRIGECLENIQCITKKFDEYAVGFVSQLDRLTLKKIGSQTTKIKSNKHIRKSVLGNQGYSSDLQTKFRTIIHRIIRKLQSLKLTVEEVLTKKVFSRKAFEKEGSMEFFKHCKEGDIEQVQLMIQKNKYLVYDYDSTKQTALHWSCTRGWNKITSILLNNGADPNAYDMAGRTPLFQAARSGNLIPVKLLLYFHADPLVKSDGKKSAIEYAENFEVRNLILKAQKVAYTMSMSPVRSQNKVWQTYGKPNYIVRDKELN